MVPAILDGRQHLLRQLTLLQILRKFCLVLSETLAITSQTKLHSRGMRMLSICMILEYCLQTGIDGKWHMTNLPTICIKLEDTMNLKLHIMPKRLRKNKDCRIHSIQEHVHLHVIFQLDHASQIHPTSMLVRICSGQTLGLPLKVQLHSEEKHKAHQKKEVRHRVHG